MLPDHLFLNVIDTELQQQIADTETMDKDATEVLLN